MRRERPKPVFCTTKESIDLMSDTFVPGALLRILMHGMTKQDILKRAMVYSKRYPERRIYVRRRPPMNKKTSGVYGITPIKGKILVNANASTPKNECFERAFKEAKKQSRKNTKPQPKKAPRKK